MGWFLAYTLYLVQLLQQDGDTSKAFDGALVVPVTQHQLDQFQITGADRLL